MAQRIVRADGRDAWAGDVLRLLGVKRLPDEGLPEVEIQGVRVWAEPKRVVMGCRWCGSAWDAARSPERCPGCLRSDSMRRRHMSGLRVMARCGCGHVVPVGRLGQHVCGSKRSASRKRRPGVVWFRDLPVGAVFVFDSPTLAGPWVKVSARRYTLAGSLGAGGRLVVHRVGSVRVEVIRKTVDAAGHVDAVSGRWCRGRMSASGHCLACGWRAG